MKRFSISDIEILTGIKAHTIRIWEQRYTFLTSKRSETNIRFYDSEDLRLFLNIATLNQNGYKISKISKMDLAEINTIVDDLKGVNFNSGAQVQMLANATLQLDGREFDEVLSGCVKEMGFKNAMDEVIFPFLSKIKFMWQVGIITIAHERFATHLICNKIIVVTSKLPTIKSPTGERYLLFLPYGEAHETGLLFIKYLLKENGQQILYLGADVPLVNLIETILVYEPQYAVSVLTQTRTVAEINTLVNRITQSLPDLSIILAGDQMIENSINSNPRLIVLQNIEKFGGLINTDSISLVS